MVLVKNWPFFNLFFLENLGLENVFYDIVDGTNTLVGHKNRNFKTSKHCDFLKGASPWFSSKIGHFIIFFY